MGFNFTDVQDSSFSPVDPGWYSARVDEAFFKDTRAGDGEFLSVKFALTSKAVEGRIVFSMYNVKNPNPKAVQIGFSQLVSMLVALGNDKSKMGSIEKPQILEMIDGKELNIKLKIKKDDTYGDKNEITSYKKLEEKKEDKSDIPF